MRTNLLICLLLLGGLALTKADVVTDWDAALLRAFANQGNAATPPDNTRTLAMASVAMFDAVNSINRSYSSYSGYYSTNGPASAEAAAAQAAHDVLVGIFAGNTSQINTFNSLLNTQLATISDTTQRNNGISLGQSLRRPFWAHVRQMAPRPHQPTARSHRERLAHGKYRQASERGVRDRGSS